MTTSAMNLKPLAVGVSFTDSALRVRLADEREISVPLTWFPRLVAASPAQRGKWRFIAKGEGIHWPEIDEDISVAGLLGLTD